MSLVHEATFRYVGYSPGDTKVAHYDISFTLQQVVEPETGWLLLNGAVVSQTTYSVLYAKYGTAFNTGGEGAGNFRLPDLTEGRVPIAKGLSNFTTRGASGGEINHVLSAAEMYSHVHGIGTLAWTSSSSSHGHTVSGSVSGDTGHSHTTPNTTISGSTISRNGTGTATTNSNTTTATTGADSGHSHGITLSVANAASSVSITGSINGMTVTGGSAHNNMQPYIVIGGWLVKYK